MDIIQEIVNYLEGVFNLLSKAICIGLFSSGKKTEYCSKKYSSYFAHKK